MERRPLEIAFRIGSIPVVVEPSFWLVSVLFGLSDSAARVAIWVAVVFLSVLLHELGHAVANRLQGSGASIRLYAFGGLTFSEKQLSRRGEIFVALAGPLSGFLFGGIAYLLFRSVQHGSPLATEALFQLLWVNFGWGVINLVPVLPLDGAHAFLALLGPQRQRLGLLVGGCVGVGVALIAAAEGFKLTKPFLPVGGDALIYITVLFGLLALRNFQAASALGKRREPPVTADQALSAGWQSLSKGDEEDAERVARLVLEHAPDPDSRNRARDLLAWTALARGRHREALRHLERSEPPEAARALTWAMVLESLDEAPRAAPYGLQAVEHEPSETSANLAIRLLTRTGKAGDARQLAERFDWPKAGSRAAALARIDLELGAFSSAARQFEAAFEASGSPQHAYDAACSLARGGDRSGAVAWVKRAVEAGLADLRQIGEDPDLSSIQGEPEIRELVERAKGNG